MSPETRKSTTITDHDGTYHLIRCALCPTEWDDDDHPTLTEARQHAHAWGWHVPSPHDEPDDPWVGLDVCPSCIQAAADTDDARLAEEQETS